VYFVKKMENRGGGVFLVKNGPFLNAGCIMYSISIFYFTFYLFGGGVRTDPTHPLPAYGPDLVSYRIVWIRRPVLS